MTAPSNANTSGLPPTDALRLVPTKATPQMIAAMDKNISGYKMGLGSDFLHGVWAAALKAAPASPLPGGGDMDWQSVAMWMGFSASVIKNGEPWSDQCQQHYDEAKAAFARLAAPTGEPK